MEMVIDFPGGSRVDAHFDTFTIMTDQPADASAPTPFATFLASIGTCAGIYVLNFCQQRELPTDGIRLVQRMDRDQVSGLVGKIDLEIQVPETFPQKYVQALVRAAEKCTIKRHLECPPQIDIFTSVVKPV